MIDAYEQGTTAAAIAGHHGGTKNSVLLVLREHGVPIRRQPLAPSTVRKARSSYEAGAPIASIAEEFTES